MSQNFKSDDMICKNFFYIKSNNNSDYTCSMLALICLLNIRELLHEIGIENW
jgi:hypothetical protein